jgi:5S rRNA maturation endonuclease (ribonuclease M5)
MRPVDIPPGWKPIKQHGDGGVTLRPEGEDQEWRKDWKRPPVRVKRVPRANWNRQQGEFYAACTNEMADTLAEALGLRSGVFLSVFGLGWCEAQQCWTFPMHSDPETVVGIRTRHADGSKRALKGSQAGCFMTMNPVSSWSDPVMICEGPTDTAALGMLGFTAVGRPSCSGGTEIIKNLMIDREVVIVSDGDSPGRRGADALSHELVRICRSVKIIEPPAKDMREWLKGGATRAAVEFLINETKPRGGTDAKKQVPRRTG